MKEDFNFTGTIEVATIGQFGGIVILWRFNVLNVEPVKTTNQEIHYHIQVHPFPFKWLFTAIYASNDLGNRQTLWQKLMCIYDNYNGP